MIKELSLFSRSEAQICRVEIKCILLHEIMKCQTVLCLKKKETKILLCTMTAPPPGICLLIILIWIQTACVRVRVCVLSVNEKAEWLIGLHGLFCHLYFSVHRDYLRKYNCCWVGCVLMLFF